MRAVCQCAIIIVRAMIFILRRLQALRRLRRLRRLHLRHRRNRRRLRVRRRQSRRGTFSEGVFYQKYATFTRLPIFVKHSLNSLTRFILMLKFIGKSGF